MPGCGYEKRRQQHTRDKEVTLHEEACAVCSRSEKQSCSNGEDGVPEP